MPEEPGRDAVERIVMAVMELVQVGGKEPTAEILEQIARRVREARYPEASPHEAGNA